MGCGGTSSLRNVTESSRLSLDGPFAFHHLTEVRSYYAAAGIPVQRRRRRNQIGEVKVKEEERQNDTSNLKDAPPFMKYPGRAGVLDSRIFLIVFRAINGVLFADAMARPAAASTAADGLFQMGSTAIRLFRL